MTPLHRILADINAMQLEEIPPTPHAVNTAVRVILDAGYTDLIGRAYTGGGGELRVMWQSGDRSLRLVVPSNAEHTTYLQYQDGHIDYGTDGASGETLAKWLDWVSDAN